MKQHCNGRSYNNRYSRS